LVAAAWTGCTRNTDSSPPVTNSSAAHDDTRIDLFDLIERTGLVGSCI
jgi:hypothetical protein